MSSYRASCLVLALVLGTMLAVTVDRFGMNPPRHPALLSSTNESLEQPEIETQPGDLAEASQPDVASNTPADQPGIAELQPVVDPLDELQTAADEPAAGDTLSGGIVSGEAVPGEPTAVEPSIEMLADLNEPATHVELATFSDSQPEPAAEPAADEGKPAPEPELDWYEDYAQAVERAQEDRKLLFIFFYDDKLTPARRAFENQTLDDPGIKATLAADYVLARFPRSATIASAGKRIALLDHPSFSEMLHKQGVAVIDFAHRKADYYGYVVSTFPFTPGKFYRKEALSIILDLPPGTLTQRTMIYAVRIHPEAPASSKGVFHPVLAEEAKLQSNYQAAILVQGHHNWDARFHRINANLPSGVLAQEVVAESWPNEGLVEACVDCVHSWRQSPGHWNAVRSRHPLFAFDIKRGRNGIWYATGIFGKR